MATAPDEAVALRLVQSGLAQGRLDQAAAALSTALAQEFDAERVYVGVVQHRFCRVVASSHAVGAVGALPLVREIARTMDEAVDQAAAVTYPPHADDRPRVTRAHAALVQRHGLGALLTVPLFEHQRAVGALVFERAAGQTIEPAWAARVQQAAAVLAPLLRLWSEHDRGPVAHARARLAQRWQALSAPRRRQAQAALLLLGLGLPLLLATRWTHHVSAPTRLEGRVQRAVVAPLDGYLKAVHARAGDSVRSGQLLVELVDDELQMELRRRQTEVAQHEAAYGDAMARQDRAALVQAEARAAEARAQLGQVQTQLARTRVVAPFDALVLSGDLQQQLAAPIKRGDALFTLAPGPELRVMLQVDERDSAVLAPGLAGEVTFSALPERRFALVIERVSPVARVEDGRNSFEAEARLLSPSPELMRPGMQGLAQLDAGARPLAWLVGHRVADWARLQWWRWVA